MNHPRERPQKYCRTKGCRRTLRGKHSREQGICGMCARRARAVRRLERAHRMERTT